MTVEVDNIDWFEEGKDAIIDVRGRRERKAITKVGLPNFEQQTFPVKRSVTTGWRISLSSPLEYDHDAGSMIRPDDWRHDALENFSYVVFENGTGSLHSMQNGAGYQYLASTVKVGDKPTQVAIPCTHSADCMGPNPFVFASVRTGWRNQVYSTIRVQSMFTPFSGYPDWQKFNISVQTYKGYPEPVQKELVDFVVVRSGCTEDQCTCEAFKNNRDLMDTVMCIKNAGIHKIEGKDYAFETGIFWSKNNGPHISGDIVHQWNTVKFHTRFTTPPVVLANVQTDFSTDKDPYNIRIRNVSNESFEFIIDEETDRAHGSEWVAYYVIGEPRNVSACWLNAERTYNMNPNHVPHNAFYAPPNCTRYEALLIGAYKDMFFLDDTNGCGGDPAGIEDYRKLCVKDGCGDFCTNSSRRLLAGRQVEEEMSPEPRDSIASRKVVFI
jgi:hypothetical protein